MLRHRVPGLGPTALLLVTALTGSTATAATAIEPASQDAQLDPMVAAQLADAKELYARGEAKFETADYSAAVQEWTEAYATLPDTDEGAQIKVLLIYNIATARERAFDVSQDPAELRQAKILLRNFDDSIASLYGEGEEAEAERARVREKIAAIDEQLAALEQPDVADDPPEPAPTPAPVIDTSDTEPSPGARGLVVGGAVALSLGAASLGVMAAGLGLGSRANDLTGLAPDDIDGRRTQFDRGRTGNTLAIVGGVGAGVLVVTGTVLLGLGLSRQHSPSVALVPSVGPQGSGLALRGRF